MKIHWKELAPGTALLDQAALAQFQKQWATYQKLVDADSPAPTDPAALTFLTMTTKPSFRAEFKAGEGGKTAVYMARWVNTRGEKGPWSDVTTATVAA